jgi:hypothetical protein
MDGKRSALIVASDAYADPGLRRLRAPASDAKALAAVLRDPGIGGFQVRTLLNQPAHEVNLAVEEFFADRLPDDLLLLHVSSHGVKDEDGELYFAAANTRLRRLGATAVAADFVNRRMNRSRSRRVVLLLDCCYAGAFERGITARAGADVGIEERFGGRGRAVITASSAMEYAFEGGQLTDTQELQPSVFTSALVEGLETGEADRDQDGMVALDELYDYVYDKVRAVTPNQTPGKWTFGVQGELVIARRARPVTTPAALPPELQGAIDNPFAEVRGGAVKHLARLAQSRHAGLALAGRMSLERLTNDDSRTVSAAATAALNDLAPSPSEPLPPEPPPSEPPPELALSATVIEFGRLPQHGASPERRILLGNAGGGTLNARAASEASWVELRQAGDDVVVAVDTSVAGEHVATVTIDSDGGTATIRVTVTVDPALSPAPPPTAVAHEPVTAGRPTMDRVQERPPPPPPAQQATRDRAQPRPGDGLASEPQRARVTPSGPGRIRTSPEGSRRQLLIWTAAIVVAAIVAAVTISFSSSPPLGAALGLLAFGLEVTSAAVVNRRERQREQLREQDERRRLLQEHCRFVDQRAAELPVVGERRDPLAFGVRKVSLPAPAAGSGGVPGDWPLYVRRDIDSELDRALKGGGVVIVVGEAQAGKTRTAFEAMQRVCNDRRLLVPKRQGSLRALADAGFTFPRTVVWLDDFDAYRGANELDRALDDLVGQPADSVVLATMRSGEYAQHRSGDATPGLFRSSSPLLGDIATVIPLSAPWSQEERRRARDLARDPRIAEALEQPETLGLVAYMTSGPQLWKKWRDALLGVQPVGAAIVAAAVDCRRIGRSRPVPVDLLQRLHEAYLERPNEARDLQSFEDGLAWACEGYALLRPVDDGSGGQGYVVFDYLVAAVKRNPDAYPVPNATWQLLVEDLDPEEAWNVGTAAYRAKLPRIAERAFRIGTRASRADLRGNAAHGLANVLLDAGEAAEAEDWLKVAADAEVTGAATNLGWLLERRGERRQAEWHYQQAYRQGDIDAANNLGVLFAESGDDRSAEDWLSKAHQAGHPEATNNLGLLLLRRGDRDGARRLFREAAARGNTEAEEHLRALPPEVSP